MIVVDDRLREDALTVSVSSGEPYEIVLNTPKMLGHLDVDDTVTPHRQPARLGGDHRIDLTVRDTDTNRPLPGVRVTLCYPDGVQETFQTDHDGRIDVEDVGYETYTVIDISSPR